MTSTVTEAARRLCAHVAETAGEITYVDERTVGEARMPAYYSPMTVMVPSRYVADLALALMGEPETPTAEAILAAFAAERKACGDWLNATDAPNVALLEWDARRAVYAQLMAAYVTANHTTIAKAERALGIVYTR